MKLINAVILSLMTVVPAFCATTARDTPSDSPQDQVHWGDRARANDFDSKY